MGQRWELETLKLETGQEEGTGTRKVTRAAPRCGGWGWEARRHRGEVGAGVARGNKRKPLIGSIGDLIGHLY